MKSQDNGPVLTPLLGMTLEDIQELVAEYGVPKFQAGQIAKWLYDKRVSTIEEMTTLSKQLRQALSSRYCVGRKAPVMRTESVDGTVKYLFETKGGFFVEAVYIPEDDRATLCISSQAGCKMNCSFCMTGRQGFHGNLSSTEIINQVLSIPESEKLTNIVFMGMGEPMDNLDAVLKTIEILTAKWGMAWSPKRITVSSIGKLRELRRLVEETGVHVAISVHSPYHNERQKLMPVEQAYPVQDVMALLREYDFAHQRRLSVEYIMWNGLNSDLKHADALAQLLKGTNARVNLIRFHKIPDSKLSPTSQSEMEAFRDRLNSHGVICTIRRSRGEDIMAACGMLAGKKNN